LVGLRDDCVALEARNAMPSSFKKDPSGLYVEVLAEAEETLGEWGEELD